MSGLGIPVIALQYYGAITCRIHLPPVAQVHALNSHLLQAGRGRVHWIDADMLAADAGRRAWADDRLYYNGKLPFDPRCFIFFN